MHSVSTTSGRRFDARPEETLLDAALRQGVNLGYSCRTGRCSSCKGRLLSGDTMATHEEIGLGEADRQEGYILTCVRRACGPVSLEIDDLGDVQLPETKTLPCRITSLERLSCDVMRVLLRLPPNSPLNFLPGQYIDVIGTEGLRRSYSVANAPRADKQLELHIREVPGGAMSQYWFHQARPNDLLRLRGPLGTFFLREQTGQHLVFLATGTGIAPVKAMLEDIAQRPPTEQPRSITVYWGGRQPSDLYYSVPDMPSLRFVPVLSRADSGWSGVRGHVQDALLHDCKDWAHTLVYACGSDAMIQSARTSLLEAGLPARQFHSDAFVCSASN